MNIKLSSLLTKIVDSPLLNKSAKVKTGSSRGQTFVVIDANAKSFGLTTSSKLSSSASDIHQFIIRNKDTFSSEQLHTLAEAYQQKSRSSTLLNPTNLDKLPSKLRSTTFINAIKEKLLSLPSRVESNNHIETHQDILNSKLQDEKNLSFENKFNQALGQHAITVKTNTLNYLKSQFNHSNQSNVELGKEIKTREKQLEKDKTSIRKEFFLENESDTEEVQKAKSYLKEKYPTMSSSSSRVRMSEKSEVNVINSKGAKEVKLSVNTHIADRFMPSNTEKGKTEFYSVDPAGPSLRKEIEDNLPTIALKEVSTSGNLKLRFDRNTVTLTQLKDLNQLELKELEYANSNDLFKLFKENQANPGFKSANVNLAIAELSDLLANTDNIHAQTLDISKLRDAFLTHFEERVSARETVTKEEFSEVMKEYDPKTSMLSGQEYDRLKKAYTQGTWQAGEEKELDSLIVANDLPKILTSLKQLFDSPDFAACLQKLT